GHDAGISNMDSGLHDAGPSTDSGGGTVTCGTMTCSSYSPGAGITFAAGCAKNASNQDVCGLSSASLGGTDAGLPAFLEKDAPGVASSACGALIDSQEPATDAGTKGNGRIDTTVKVAGMSLAISYPGCCTKKGFCSGDTDMGLLLGSTASNGGFGCMESTAFFVAQPAAQMIPCDPTTGALKLGDAGTTATVDGGLDAGH
ncbi:MAG TPA: hypothetical protein VG963_09730, partial [Polyangiaceae bacterium]|nr:hypothetical protein [Polyangiaceae bacterium]